MPTESLSSTMSSVFSYVFCELPGRHPPGFRSNCLLHVGYITGVTIGKARIARAENLLELTADGAIQVFRDNQVICLAKLTTGDWRLEPSSMGGEIVFDDRKTSGIYCLPFD
jgi:hypothetical protein